MKDFKGKVAVVTGGASGIGRGMAERFGEEGMKVVLADVEAEALDAAVAEVTGLGAEAIGVRTDVTDPAAVESLAGVTIPPRAAYLRVVLLELERLYNHVADVGAPGAGGT